MGHKITSFKARYNQTGRERIEEEVHVSYGSRSVRCDVKGVVWCDCTMSITNYYYFDTMLRCCCRYTSDGWLTHSIKRVSVEALDRDLIFTLMGLHFVVLLAHTLMTCRTLFRPPLTRAFKQCVYPSGALCCEVRISIPHRPPFIHQAPSPQPPAAHTTRHYLQNKKESERCF